MGASKYGWHSIAEIFRCEKEYELAKIYKVREPIAQTPDPLAIGLLLHAAKARWFSRKCGGGFDEDIHDAMRQCIKENFEETNLPFSEEAIERGTQYIQEYIAYWSMMPKPTVIAAEYDLGPTSLDGTETTKRTARLDDVSVYPEGGNQLYIGECKTTSKSVNETVREYELHGQPMLQYALWQLDPNGKAKHGQVAGIMLDIVKKGYGNKESEFSRIPITITEKSSKWYIEEMKRKIYVAADIRDGEWPAIRNIQGCTRYVGRMQLDCPYKPLCRYGSQAGLKYVYGDDARMLNEWGKQEDEKGAVPWEI